MDNLFAIGVGLVLRAVIDNVTNHNHRVNGSLVGLWEGAVLHHFLYKFPRSLDPYVAFAFRLFIDLLFTASVTRLAIVVLWTGLGMLLSDIGVDIAEDKRFRRLWRRLRRLLPPSLGLSSTRSPSRVQFLQVPTTSSAGSSNTATRSPVVRSPLSPQSRAQMRPPPPPTPAPIRRPSTRPVPGSFSDFSEAETEASRARRQARTPSELEYTTIPVIPDTPGIEQYANYIRPPATKSIASGLTTSNESDNDLVQGNDRPQNYSGMTTPIEMTSPPPLRGDELPPVTIIDDDDASNARDRTPQSNPVELPDPPPIPIPLRRSSNIPPQLLRMESMMTIPPEYADPQPTPGLTPPMGDVPEIPSPEDPANAAEPPEATTSGANPEAEGNDPPPEYVEAVTQPADDASLAESEGTAPSVITSKSRSALITRADTLRKEANDMDLQRAKLKRELEAAKREKDYWGAFRLKVELQKIEQSVKELHAKAARRYYIAHNQKPQPQEIDVHRLKVPEATAQVEQALYDAMVTGVPELRIITGRGNHSVGKIPVLKLAIIGHLQDHHIEAVEDATNPGVLLVRFPMQPQPGPSS